MKRKISKDVNRANSLKEMANLSLERLNSYNKIKYPSNTLKDYYDILHQLMESISLLEGIKFSGDFAHKELIDWCLDFVKMSSQEKIFLQEIRNYRNKIAYEGFFIKSQFIEQNENLINNIIKKLNKKIGEYC